MGIDASFIIGALDHDSVAEVLVTFIHLFTPQVISWVLYILVGLGGRDYTSLCPCREVR